LSGKSKIVVAMSGGVDSSVAAHLLLEQGHEACGVYMWRGSRDDAAAREEESRDARLVAERLGIPLEVLDLEAEFGGLIEYFCNEYSAGRTPNPCVMCNRRVKFDSVLKLADRIGAGSIATGHYARIDRAGGRWLLKRGVDRTKDQSYVLSYLSQQQLARAIFPNGDHTKQEIRRVAAELKLPVHDKPESQDICFIPDGDYGRFLRGYSGRADEPGPVVDTEGNVVGEHPGVRYFTVGQRHGIGIAFGRPMYVVRLDAAANTVVMGQNDALLRGELTVSAINWIVERPSEPLRAEVKIRYNQREVPATVHPLPGEAARIVLDRPVRAVTPGQAAVAYQGDTVLCGGWID